MADDGSTVLKSLEHGYSLTVAAEGYPMISISAANDGSSQLDRDLQVALYASGARHRIHVVLEREREKCFIGTTRTVQLCR